MSRYSCLNYGLFCLIALSIIISGCGGAQAGTYRHSEIRSAIDALKSADIDVKRHAAMEIAEMGLEAKEAVPDLVTALTDPDPGVKDEVATALGKMGAHAKPAVPALIAFLLDTNIPVVRPKACGALGYIGAGAVAAVPALTQALSDRETTVRYTAASALADIGPGAKAAVPTLIKSLSANDVLVRQNASLAILSIGLSPDDVPLILPYLADEVDAVRSCAAKALGALGPQAAAAVPDLKKLSADPCEYVAADACDALKRIDGTSKEPKTEHQELLNEYRQLNDQSWYMTWVDLERSGTRGGAWPYN